MDPRFDRAHGALAGLIFGWELGGEAASENGTATTSVGESVLALLASHEPVGLPTFPSQLSHLQDFYALLISGLLIGISTSTSGQQAFADAVWNNCEDEEPNCREFQAVTLVAAAVSLGLDSPNFCVSDVLVRAVDVASSLDARGAWSPEPDVVAATRRALNIVSDVNEYIESPLDRLVEQIGAGDSPSQIVPMAFALASRYQDLHLLTSPLHLGAQARVILSIAGALVGAVRGASLLRPYGYTHIKAVFKIDLKRRAHGLLASRMPYPCDLLAPVASTPSTGSSAPASFKEIPWNLRTRQRYFEPVNPPVIPHHSGGQTGRVLFLGELLVDQAMHSTEYPKRGGDVWATDLGQSTGGSFKALVAARRMGAEVVSLSPMGQGTNASIISKALRSENIVDAGPRLTGVDNGYRLIFTADNGWRLAVSTTTTITPDMSRVWAEAIQAMDPSDVLWIDGSLIDSEEHARALREAVKGLPEHARVVFDASQSKGFLKGLPHDNVIVSLRASHARGFDGFTRHFDVHYPFYDDNDTPEVQASALAMLAKRHIVLRTEEGDAYFARPDLDDARMIRPMVTRIPAPTPAQPGALPTAEVHSGTLAGCLAVGIPADRATLLANCAASLATPNSLPTRETIESAAAQLSHVDLA